MIHEILTARQVDLTLSRLAHEVVEKNRGAENLTVLGILRAGAELGRIIASQISEIEQTHVPVFDLDIYPFRDDRDGSVDSPIGAPVTTDSENPDVTDRDVLLVDDVLFTGRTIRAALDAVISFGRPRTIQLLVLVDRGHREYPIQPDYVGRTLVTKHVERVVVETAASHRRVSVEE